MACPDATEAATQTRHEVLRMALVGAGSAERLNKVRWQIGEEMVITWLVTIPVTMLLAAGIDKLFTTLIL